MLGKEKAFPPEEWQHSSSSPPKAVAHKPSAWPKFALHAMGTTTAAPGLTTPRMTAKAMKRQDVDGIAEFSWHRFGLPRDFWILIFMMLCVLVLFVTHVTIATRVATWWRAESVPPRRPQAEPSFPKGRLQEFFIARGLTPQAAVMLEMATRTAFVCSVLGLSYFIPRLNRVNQACFTMQQAAVILLFSIDVNMGKTIKNWWETFLGNLLPALHVITMFHFFPLGVRAPYDRAWCFGVLDFFAFSMVFICLNWPAGTCMFALSLQVCFTADFMNPESVVVYSDGLTTLALTGAEIGPLASSLVGLVAVLFTLALLPWGLVPSALGRAQEDAIRLAWRQGSLWSQVATGFCSDGRREVEATFLQRAVKRCQADLEMLQEHIDPSWWECGGFGRPAWVRSHVVELQEQLETMNDWLMGAVSALQTEEFGEDHARFMEGFRAEMERLCAASEELLFASASLAIRGIDASKERWQEEVRDLKTLISSVEEAQHAFASAFTSARDAELGEEALPPGQMRKHFFAFALSSYAEHTIMFARHLLSSTRPLGPSLAEASLGHLLAVLRPAEDPGQVRRTCAAFFASTLVGYFGIPDVMSPLDASVASTVAFMVPASGGSGSALLNNVKRFIGVAGGKLTGRLFFSVFCPCTWWGPYTAFAATFCFLTLTTLLIFGSPTFGFMSRLAAAYGVHGLLKVCYGRGNGFDSFSLIQAQLIAILFAAAADTVVGNLSASDIACREWKQYTDCTLRFVGSLWQEAERGMAAEGASPAASQSDLPVALSRSLSMKSGPTMNHRALRRRLADYSLQTTRFGYEAAAEPRLRSGRFNLQLWDELVDLSIENGIVVVLLSAAAAECQQRPSQMEALGAILRSPAIHELSSSMLKRGHDVADLSEELLASRPCGPRCRAFADSGRPQEPEDLGSVEEVLRDMSQALVAAQRAPTKAQQGSPGGAAPPSCSAMDDGLCLVAVFAFALSRSFDILRQFEVHCYVAQCSGDF